MTSIETYSRSVDTTLFYESMIVLELNNYCSWGSDRYSGYSTEEIRRKIIFV